MPFIYDYERKIIADDEDEEEDDVYETLGFDDDADDDEDRGLDPRVEDFVYVPAPDWSGVPDPVRFSLASSSGSNKERQQLFAIAVPGLQTAGVRRAYCRYDGGNDEGFCWPDSFEMNDGERLSADNLAERLKNADFLEDTARGVDNARRTLEMLCVNWTYMLLGSRYGDGPHLIYGAFTVDLDACTITDDRNASLGVENLDPDTGRFSGREH